MFGKTKTTTQKIRTDTEDLKGRYSNLIQVAHTNEEFVMDFLFIQPPDGVSVAKIIVSPAHFERIIEALQDNFKKYEEKLGQTKEKI